MTPAEVKKFAYSNVYTLCNKANRISRKRRRHMARQGCKKDMITHMREFTKIFGKTLEDRQRRFDRRAKAASMVAAAKEAKVATDLARSMRPNL